MLRQDLPEMLNADSASAERISELVDLVGISGDGLVNYLEFLHAFQPVDRRVIWCSVSGAVYASGRRAGGCVGSFSKGDVA